MSTIRKIQAPTYSAIDSKKKLDLVLKEILRLKPDVEVTIAGCTDVAKGKIVEWWPDRHFFAVQWSKTTSDFEIATREADAEVFSYFKVKMMTALTVFKCRTVRQVSAETYHYRIPKEVYQQQRRGALRVPVETEVAYLITPHAKFEILDLSTEGARIRIPPTSKLKPGSLIKNAKIKLGKTVIEAPDFEVKIVSIFKDENPSVGGKFLGLEAAQKTEIKQFLVEALHHFFKENLK